MRLREGTVGTLSNTKRWPSRSTTFHRVAESSAFATRMRSSACCLKMRSMTRGATVARAAESKGRSRERASASPRSGWARPTGALPQAVRSGLQVVGRDREGDQQHVHHAGQEAGREVFEQGGHCGCHWGHLEDAPMPGRLLACGDELLRSDSRSASRALGRDLRRFLDELRPNKNARTKSPDAPELLLLPTPAYAASSA